jgi:type 1 glutamine amidotransferase
MDQKLQIAVLTENHPYDVIGFQKMLDSFTDCACYVQPLDLFVQDTDNRQRYDAVLWYNMNWDPPKDGSVLRKYMEEELGTNKQGIVLLHHALLSFQDWEAYTEVCGLRHRGAGGLFKYAQNQAVRECIADPSHPITAGLSPFTITDETYTIGEPEEAGNHTLLTTDNPTSIKQLAWTRQYKTSRVFCYASGHDNKVYADENFRLVLHRGIQWTAAGFSPVQG